MRDETVNSNLIFDEKVTTDRKPMFSEIRMSRLAQPRATVVAMILLAVVFLLFGVFASAVEPTYSAAPNTLEGMATIFGNWVFGA